jgi:uncharacterized protein (TIGR00299 family) protein
VAPDTLRAELAKLNLPGYELDIRQISKQGFNATRVEVKRSGRPGHRSLHDIEAIIDDSALSEPVRTRARSVFRRLAQAEAKVHGSKIEKVHFHEVGAVDAIVDVAGAAIGVDALGLQEIACSPIPTGNGTVRCEHGVLPIPAPATAELLTGIPLAECAEVGELTTPTGAAILTSLTSQFGPIPAMTVECCGYGAGSRDGSERPNLLRLFVGEGHGDATETDSVVVLETNLDDATGEQIGHAFEALFAAGALDAFVTPVAMKKNRPGILLSAIVPLERQSACEEVFFAETGTFGIRGRVCTRRKLARSTETVSTPFGDIRIKLGRLSGRVVVAAPEYEDCAAAARTHDTSLCDVMSVARTAWQTRQGRAGP